VRITHFTEHCAQHVQKVTTTKITFNFREGQMKKWKLLIVLGVALIMIAVLLPVLGTGEHTKTIHSFGRIVYPP
jgi:hypothetical protein